MKKSVVNLMLAGALCLGTGLPVFAQQANDADKAFAMYDADKDGKLSAAEFGKVTTADGQQASIQEWDANGDGSVSKAEFAAKYGSNKSDSAKPAQPKE